MQQKRSTKLLFLGLMLALVLSLGIVGVVVAVASPSTALPPGKQVSLDKDATIRAAGLTNAATLPPDLTQALRYIPTPDPTLPPLLGLRSASEVGQPFQSVDFKMQNEWSGYIGNKLTEVMAGNSGKQSDQGVVIVQSVLPGKNDWVRKDISTPVKEGAVKITAVSGLLFTLVTEKGTSLVFDVQTLTFK